jgi:hypothetical protein
MLNHPFVACSRVSGSLLAASVACRAARAGSWTASRARTCKA